MINYEVRTRDLKGIVISFERSESSSAWAWYDRYYSKMELGDSRFGHVLVKDTWETDAEANERRMGWLDRHIGLNGGRVDLDIPEGMKLSAYIDSLNKPEHKVEVLADHFKDKGLAEVGVAAHAMQE